LWTTILLSSALRKVPLERTERPLGSREWGRAVPRAVRPVGRARIARKGPWRRFPDLGNIFSSRLSNPKPQIRRLSTRLVIAISRHHFHLRNLKAQRTHAARSEC